MSSRSPYSILVAGSSKIKIDAAQAAVDRLELHATVNGVNIPSSGVNEQPVGEGEILKGAETRAYAAYRADPRGRVYLGIENGIAKYDSEWRDYAIVYVYQPETGKAFWLRSGTAPFPTEAVERTRRKPGGFEQNTVGKTLAEMGLVRRHADPHLDLGGVSRLDILTEAVVEALRQIDQ